MLPNQFAIESDLTHACPTLHLQSTSHRLQLIRRRPIRLTELDEDQVAVFLILPNQFAIESDPINALNLHSNTIVSLIYQSTRTNHTHLNFIRFDSLGLAHNICFSYTSGRILGFRAFELRHVDQPPLTKDEVYTSSMSPTACTY